jgi:hypothetical protein
MDEASQTKVRATHALRCPHPKGYRTMLAIHKPLDRRMRSRLKTISIGLGLVRLLQDARRFGEARRTLALLEAGCREPAMCQPPRFRIFEVESDASVVASIHA